MKEIPIFSQTIVTAGKAAILSSVSLFLFLMSYEATFNLPIIPFFFSSIIITFFIALFMILITIVPFYVFMENYMPISIFKMIFPGYAISFFLLISMILAEFSSNLLFTAVGIISFLTAMQSWVWFFKK